MNNGQAYIILKHKGLTDSANYFLWLDSVSRPFEAEYQAYVENNETLPRMTYEEFEQETFDMQNDQMDILEASQGQY